MFLGGLNDAVTLREHDEYHVIGDRITVTIRQIKDPTKVLEQITYERRNLIAFKVRDTTLRIVDKRPIPTLPSGEESVQPAD
jgi:hypothetical protein